MKVIVNNRKARFEYEILQTLEAGLVLQGTEIKSIRSGRVNLSEGFCRIDAKMEVYLCNVHISHYEFGNRNNHDPLRERKLLLHKREIHRLYGTIREKGTTLVPLKLYLQQGLVKIQIAIVKGKKTHDKRESLKKKDAQREIQRSLKNY